MIKQFGNREKSEEMNRMENSLNDDKDIQMTHTYITHPIINQS